MKKQIEDLKENLKKLEEAYAAQQKEDYENQCHNNFEDGDVVTNGTEIGVVGWTENKAMNCPHKLGYMGISLITGSRGFKGFAKRNDYSLVTDKYYNKKHKVEIEITGLEIEDLKYDLGPKNFNPSKVKTKMLYYLDSLHKTQ